MESEAGEMGYKKNDDDHSEGVMNQLADSILGLSDEAIVGEAGEAGADPNEEAERTRLVLRRKSQLWALEGLWAESTEVTTSHRKTSLLKR